MSEGESDLLRRYLEQQAELGGGDLVFDDLSRADALALSARGLSGASPGSQQPGAPDGSTGVAGPSPSESRVEPPSAGAPSEFATEYDALRQQALVCTRCRLAKGRTQVVFSDGNPNGRLMVVGEAPGANEDRTGLPFVGPAGQLLDLLLAAIDLSRSESVYICNVIKCRPPGNRNPLPEEIDACAPYLKKQIALVKPEVILAVGSFAAQFLTGTTLPLGKLRGTIYNYEGAPLVVTYHPAALLRNSSWTRATWDDLQLLRQVMDGTTDTGRVH